MARRMRARNMSDVIAATDSPDADAIRWELSSHGADVGVRGSGGTLAAAFEGVALALTAVVCDPARVASAAGVTLQCTADDPEDLLYEWINALVYEMATRHMLFSRFSVRIAGAHLTAQAWGEPLDPQRHEPAVEIKGATYTDLQVRRAADRWTAQCIVDV